MQWIGQRVRVIYPPFNGRQNRREGCTARAMNWAAMDGHLHVIRWLSKNKCKGWSGWSSDTIINAATYGYLDIIQWCYDPYYYRESNMWVTQQIMDKAAGNGHLEIVQWVYKKTQIPCSIAGINTSATNGHDLVVQWLYKNCKVRCTKTGIRRALQNGHKDLVNWLNVQ